MTPVLFVLAAAIGAVGRHLLNRIIATRQALLAVNTFGAGLLSWIVTSDPGPGAMTVVGVGFCGALTTFSSFAVEARSLGPRSGAAYAVVTLICVIGAAGLVAAWPS